MGFSRLSLRMADRQTLNTTDATLRQGNDPDYLVVGSARVYLNGDIGSAAARGALYLGDGDASYSDGLTRKVLRGGTKYRRQGLD